MSWPQPRKPWHVLVGLVAVVAMAGERLLALARAAPTDFDDAYVYLRYAEHLLAGQGLVWNVGEGPVYGVTSLLHLAVVTVLRAVLPHASLANVLGAASGAAAIAFVAALAAALALGRNHGRLQHPWLVGTAVVLVLVAYREAFFFHAATGMDTMLAALANTALVFATVRLVDAPSRTTVAVTAIAAVLAVLARPDNLLCALFCPAFALVLPQPRAHWRLLAGFAAAALIGIGGLAMAEWVILGSPVPLSFFAKQPRYYGAFAGEFAWNPFLFLKVFGYSIWPFAVALILFADREGWRRAAVLLAPAVASIAVLFRFNQIMGHLGRFYYPLLPFFVAAGAREFDAWMGRRPRLAARVLLERAGVAAIVVLGAGVGLSMAGRLYGARAATVSLQTPGGFHVPARAPLPELDSWQAAQAVAAIARDAPEATMAMSEHGLPGAVAPQTAIVDVLGLHDSYFASHRFSAAELFRRQPDLIWMPHEDHTQMLDDIVASPELWAHYDFYPEGFFHGLALRTDGPHRARLAALLAAQWQEAYPGYAMADYVAVRDE